MTLTCPECNGTTIWDDSVGSAVCTSCGTLTDPSQSVLTSQYDFSHEPARYNSDWVIGTGKRSRPSSSWALADQGKEARDSRNLSATVELIESLSRSLNATGLSPRATNLFHQAREAIQFRWGRKAKLIAGVCLAIALRESNRPDCLRDIAYLLEEPFPAISRSFISVTAALGLSLSRVETGFYIPILQRHLSSLLQDASNPVSAILGRELSSISLHAVSNVAISLSNVLARIGPPSLVQHPTPPVACALFILALESELRTTTKQLGSLAEILGARLSVGKSTVMTCYKTIQDTVALLAENVPWLDKYRPKNGRAKVAKRNVVARAVKDIVTFYDDSWKKIKKPNFDIAYEDGLEPCQDDINGNNDSDDSFILPRKKPKVEHRGQQAMQFLLNPVTGPTPKLTSSFPLDTTEAHKSAPHQSSYPFLSYFLSTPTSSRKPTRLQILTAARGGADEIADEELFEDGELESLMLSEEEVKIVAHMQDWEGDEEDTRVKSKLHGSGKQKMTPLDDTESGRCRSRIDLDALAKFLSDDRSGDDQPLTGLLDAEYDDSSADEIDANKDETGDLPPGKAPLSSMPPSVSADEIVIQHWRPLSPGTSSIEAYEDWYDEVYG